MTKRTIAVGAACALIASAGTAVSQGTGGPPSGTLDLEVHILHKPGFDGINFAYKNAGGKHGPSIGDTAAANAAVFVNGQKAGRGYHTETVTARPAGKKYKGGGVWTATSAYELTDGVLWTSCVAHDNPTPNQCTIIGGSGRYAGARGSAVEGAPTVDNRKMTVIPIHFTFMP